jgi:hypothetical protein
MSQCSRRSAEGRTVSDLHCLTTWQPSTAFTRYINMDYIFFNTMLEQHCELMKIIGSYDIGCQWSRNLWTRMKLFPWEYHIDRNSVEIVFLVPKFHLPAHRPACEFHSSCRTDRQRSSGAWLVKHQCVEFKYEGNGPWFTS